MTHTTHNHITIHTNNLNVPAVAAAVLCVTLLENSKLSANNAASPGTDTEVEGSTGVEAGVAGATGVLLMKTERETS